MGISGASLGDEQQMKRGSCMADNWLKKGRTGWWVEPGVCQVGDPVPWYQRKAALEREPTQRFRTLPPEARLDDRVTALEAHLMVKPGAWVELLKFALPCAAGFSIAQLIWALIWWLV